MAEKKHSKQGGKQKVQTGPILASKLYFRSPKISDFVTFLVTFVPSSHSSKIVTDENLRA
jgi:hypothetical protein